VGWFFGSAPAVNTVFPPIGDHLLVVFAQSALAMTDPPGEKPAEHAPGDGGLGAYAGAARVSDRPQRKGVRSTPYEFSSSSSDASDPDFETFHSRKSRRKKSNQKQQHQPNTSNSSAKAVPSSTPVQKRNGKQRASNQRGGQTGLSQVGRKIYQLKDWLRRGADTTIIVELFAGIQRLWRTPEEEAKTTFKHTFDADDSVECGELHEALRHLLVGKNGSNAKFLRWLQTTRLRTTGGEVKSSGPIIGDRVGSGSRTAWDSESLSGWQQRPLTVAERDFLQRRDPSATSRTSIAPLDTTSRVLLLTAAEASQQVT
jgi:hypothetical protein